MPGDDHQEAAGGMGIRGAVNRYAWQLHRKGERYAFQRPLTPTPPRSLVFSLPFLLQGKLRLSQGGAYAAKYAMRFAAGFGSQVAFALYAAVDSVDDVAQS